MPPAARPTDTVSHPAPPVLTPGPGSSDVLIGYLPAWRAIPTAAAGPLQAAKQTSDAAIKTAEAATTAATGTPGYAAAKTAEETTKATAATTMASTISAAAGGADKHACVTPLPAPPHGPGVVIDGSPTVLVNNLPAARQGDSVLEPVGPPNKITGGESTVIIGEEGDAAAAAAAAAAGGGGGGGEDDSDSDDSAGAPGPSAGTSQGAAMSGAYSTGAPFCGQCSG